MAKVQIIMNKKMKTSGDNLAVDWDEQLADEAEFDEFWQEEDKA